LGLRLLALLIGLGLLLGVSVAAAAVALTAIWPDRAGMCDASAGPCNDLTVEQLAQFSGIDLPGSATIDDARYARVDNVGLLFATVVLASGETDPLRSSDYRVSPSLSWASEVDALMLDNLVLYQGVESVTGPGYEAASGQRDDGHTVIFLRISRAI
jgi:hypothetical protein